MYPGKNSKCLKQPPRFNLFDSHPIFQRIFQDTPGTHPKPPTFMKEFPSFGDLGIHRGMLQGYVGVSLGIFKKRRGNTSHSKSR